MTESQVQSLPHGDGRNVDEQSDLGFGVVAPDVSLGLLISQYESSFTTRPWLFWWPGFFIISIALCVNFIGDGLRDAFDPRQRRRITKKDRLQAKLQIKAGYQTPSTQKSTLKSVISSTFFSTMVTHQP